MKKLISLLICVLMIFNIFPIKTFAEEKSFEEIIRPQIEAFAKSIDQKKRTEKRRIHSSATEFPETERNFPSEKNMRLRQL